MFGLVGRHSLIDCAPIASDRLAAPSENKPNEPRLAPTPTTVVEPFIPSVRRSSPLLSPQQASPACCGQTPTAVMMTMPNTSFLSYLILERGADALHAALAPPLVNLGRALQHLGHGAGNLQEERGRVLDPVVLPSDVPGPGVSAEDAFDGDRIDHQRETLEIHPTNHCEGMYGFSRFPRAVG